VSSAARELGSSSLALQKHANGADTLPWLCAGLCAAHRIISHQRSVNVWVTNAKMVLGIALRWISGRSELLCKPSITGVDRLANTTSLLPFVTTKRTTLQVHASVWKATF
jgi:hypothetical protein